MNQASRLEEIVRDCPDLMRVLAGVRDLGLREWMVFSGAVYQRVLNRMTGRDRDYGVKDYDVGYFDAADLSYAGEDRVIRRAADAFPSPLREMVEVRNQARVHLWFEDHFGEPYTPLSGTAEALQRFASPMFAVGVTLQPDGAINIAAPFGLEDLFSLRLRPNPNRSVPQFTRVASGVVRRWPEVRVETA